MFLTKYPRASTTALTTTDRLGARAAKCFPGAGRPNQANRFAFFHVEIGPKIQNSKTDGRKIFPAVCFTLSWNIQHARCPRDSPAQTGSPHAGSASSRRIGFYEFVSMIIFIFLIFSRTCHCPLFRGKWQATPRPSQTSFRAGSCCKQISCAYGQRL